MIKKIIIITTVILLVIASSFVILNLDNSSNLIFATSISVTQDNFTVKKNSQITSSDYGLKVFPNNYNQKTTFSSSNSNIATVNESGTISCLDKVGVTTITIFAKSSSTKSISKNLTITVEQDGNVSIEHKIVEIYENSTCYNVLTAPPNTTITVSCINNLIDYNYVTGLVSINNNHSTKYGYDKVIIEVNYEGVSTTTISFDVVVIKTINLSVGEFKLVNFENNNINNDQLSTNLVSSSNSVSIEQQNYDNYLVIAQNAGTATYTISCSYFTYKFYFIVE